MVASIFPAVTPHSHIRRFDLTRDLDPVADLIELCFPIHLDPDGKTYINEMRKTAWEMRLMGRLGGFSNQYPGKSSGFVWEENGHIIGNLSLIPHMKGGRRVVVIANVAVHPNHRRRGIAHELTQLALQILRQQGETEAWLQVRDDNPPAIQLYRRSGFSEQALRTTWRICPRDRIPGGNAHTPPCLVGRWYPRDWITQQSWLDAAYPADLRWQWPVDFRQFAPDLLQRTKTFLDGPSLKHWVVKEKGKFLGVVTWQKTNTYANNLWLAFPVEKEAELLPGSLAQVLQRLPQKHPLSIDYPQGRGGEQLSRLGFTEFRTLIWMVYRF